MTNLDELTARRPPNWDRVAEHQEQMLAEVRAYRLRELREKRGLTQVQLARELEITQNRVSAIERGNIETSQLDTVRRYIEAVGGKLKLVAEFGEESFVLA